MVKNRDGRTPGELLQEAREARRLTLEQLAAETKIPQQLLRALERDEYHKISGSLYIKSFLRSFAEAVGLDPGEIVTLYEAGRGQTAAAPDAADDIWQDATTEVRKVGVAYGTWLRRWGLPLLVLMALAVWWFVLRGNDGADVTDRGLTASETLLGDDEPYAAAPARPESAGSDTVGGVPGAAAAAAGSVTAVDGAAGNAATDPQLPPARLGGPLLEFSDGRTRSLVLRLLCRNPVPISVDADGVDDPQAVQWPVDARPDRLPATGVVAGRPYRVRQGLVVYWGAEDYFNVALGSFENVTLTLNGLPLAIGSWQPDRVVLVDRNSPVSNPDR